MGEFRGTISAAIGTSILASVAFSLLPWPIRYLIDNVLLGQSEQSRSQKLSQGLGFAGLYLLIQLIAAVLMSWSFYLFAKASLRMIYTLRGRMLRHLRGLSLGYHANRSTGEMIFRSINDARAIQEVMLFGVQAWVMPVFQIALMVALMATLDVVLTLVTIAVAPLLVWTIRHLTGRTQSLSEQSRSHMGRLTALI